MRTFLRAWGKFLTDLSATRVQVFLAIASVWCGLGYATIRVVFHALGTIKTAADAATILLAIAQVFLAMSAFALGTVGAWYAGKKLNGGEKG